VLVIVPTLELADGAREGQPSTTIGPQNVFFAVLSKKLNICQDRLGTNIGKVEKKDTFLQDAGVRSPSWRSTL
jgi:hypothetical protein